MGRPKLYENMTPAERKADDAKREAQYREETRKRQEAEAKALAAKIKAFPLPKGIEESDLVSDYKNSDKLRDATPENGYNSLGQFDIWFSEGGHGFGWCIPVLLISKSTRMGLADRQYAISIESQKQVRIGRGPHIKAIHTVHVTKANKQRLLDNKYLEIIEKGEIKYQGSPASLAAD